jgi:hypothetical protein
MSTLETEDPTAPFHQVLVGALALPKREQVRLVAVLQAISRAPVADGAAAVAVQADDANVEQWLQRISSASAWDRLQLIDDALANVDPQEDDRELLAARDSLLAEFPGLAARSAVTRLVQQYPWACLIGGVGLVVGVVSSARWLFRLLF